MPITHKEGTITIVHTCHSVDHCFQNVFRRNPEHRFVFGIIPVSLTLIVLLFISILYIFFPNHPSRTSLRPSFRSRLWVWEPLMSTMSCEWLWVDEVYCLFNNYFVGIYCSRQHCQFWVLFSLGFPKMGRKKKCP